jgi:hypothetical protein
MVEGRGTERAGEREGGTERKREMKGPLYKEGIGRMTKEATNGGREHELGHRGSYGICRKVSRKRG